MSDRPRPTYAGHTDWRGLADIDRPIDAGWAIVRVSADRTTVTRICKGCAVSVTTPFDLASGRAQGVVVHAPWCTLPALLNR